LIVAYLQAGARAADDARLGFELEHIITYGANSTKRGSAVPFAGEQGVATILEGLAPHYEQQTRSNPLDPEDLNSPLLGLARADATITLEPGAQFEFSASPIRDLAELQHIWETFNNELSPIIDDLGYECHTTGYQPRSRVADIELLPKKRYRIMDRYFRRTGKHGINMMRGSAATQVAIDYTDEADAITKMRLAAALSPLLALLTDNSPVFEGAPAPTAMTRTVIWNDVDPDRSMMPPGLFSEGYDFAAYARTVLTAPLILTTEHGETHAVNDSSAADCYNLSRLTTADIEHIQSMFFFDVRLRHYVEIRMADSLPFPYALAYVALLKGIFYDEQNLQELSAHFEHFTDDTVPTIKTALIKDGYNAPVEEYYQECVQTALADLLARARRALSPDEAAHLNLLDQLVAEKTTLAAIALRAK